MKRTEMEAMLFKASNHQGKRAEDVFCLSARDWLLDHDQWKSCTGNACKGDIVVFGEAVFDAKDKKRFSHYRITTGKIIHDFYGGYLSQHVFLLKINDCSDGFYTQNSKQKIKARKLYKLFTYRRIWKHEERRKETLNEKNERGQLARAEREWQKKNEA